MPTSAPDPLLSLIVPHYNMLATLPRLLESVLAQSLRSLEVVVVDDASGQSCRELVQAYQNKGLALRLIESSTNQGPKNARLAGVLAARGHILAFADADDMLWGTEALEHHARLLLQEEVDMVHFNAVHRIPESGEEKIWAWCAPFAPTLQGGAILSAYVLERRASPVCVKLFSRTLWLEFMEEARKGPRYTDSENVYLSTFAFAHARTYRGSAIPGYYYFHTPEDTDLHRSAQRIQDFNAMRRFFAVYLAGKGCSAQAVAASDDLFTHWMRLYAHKLGYRLASPGDFSLGKSGIRNIHEPEALLELTRTVDAAEYTQALHYALMESSLPPRK